MIFNVTWKSESHAVLFKLEGILNEEAKDPSFILALHLLHIWSWVIQPFIKVPFSISVKVNGNTYYDNSFAFYNLILLYINIPSIVKHCENVFYYYFRNKTKIQSIKEINLLRYFLIILKIYFIPSST